MNLIHRSIWNDQTGTFVAVSENTRSAGKKISSGTSAAGGDASFRLKVLAVSLMLACGAGVQAQPVGGVVSAGSATIGGTPANMTINQTTPNVAINWQSFGIQAGQSVQFVQPGSSSVALNRVVGSNPSNILGNLSANGKVFLVNPNGILFGQGASVNVGGLVASTMNITDANFMARNYQFSGAGSGAVLNQGTINAADGGYVALLGANVSNQGVISAKLGTVALAAGNAVTLDVAGDKLLNVTVDQGAVNALVENGGLIKADGGNVLMTTQAVGSLLSNAVNNTGVVQAQTIENHNGTIKLLGGMENGTVNVGRTLDVSGKSAGQTGGSVTATAHHVGLFGASIDASGDAGGGTVLVGGGYQGNNPSVQNASAIYMSADSAINVDALTNGKGGTAVLWSNDSTRAYGTIMARGGAQGGNGGLIETSGHWLDAEGITINASSPNGKNGMWLLDPADVMITAGTTAGAFNGGNPNIFSPASGAGSSTVDVSALRTALETAGGTDVTITTTNIGAPGSPPSGLGNITVASALTWTPTNSSTLTLSALAGDVNIDAPISATRGNLVVCCGQDINVRAAITIASAAGTGGAAGGSVLLSAGRDIRIERTIANPLTDITGTNANIEICAGRDVILSNTFNPGLAPLMTLTNGTTNAGLSLASLGVPLGLTLSAGNAATGPGVAGGTVKFVNGGLGGTYITTTTGGPGTPIRIIYNPTSYATPTDYSGNFTGSGGPVTSSMLVFPEVADKFQGGSTAAVFTGLLKADAANVRPGGVTLATVGTGTFDSTATLGTTGVTFTGFALGGAVADFALPLPCCAPVQRTSGTVVAEAIVPPVVTPPPAAIPPVAAAPIAAPLPVIQPVPPSAFPSGPVPPNVVALAVVPPPEESPIVLNVVAPPETPVVAVSETQVVAPPATPFVAPRNTPVVVPPKPYVPPVHVRKQDRN